MKWSLKLGEVAGIKVYMHTTFLLLLGWVALSYWIETHSVGLMVQGVLFICLLFGCVILHEFGHALTAKRYGIRTRDITLLPIGGVARLERMPDDPKQELWVALAGPAVNVVIAAVLYAWILLTSALLPIEEVGVVRGSMLQRLMYVNLVLVVFNLLPAFPMDGGRVVRAILAMRMPYVKATRIAAGLGQAMAFAFGFLGLFTNPFLLFIALFVYIGAAQESSITEMRGALSGIPVDHAMITDFRTLEPHDGLHHAIELILTGSQQDFPVVEDGQVVGILTRTDLLTALAQGRQGATVGEIMQREFQTVDGYEMLETVFQRLQQCPCRTVPVVRRGQLIGMVTTDNLGEFLMIQQALHRGEQADPDTRQDHIVL